MKHLIMMKFFHNCMFIHTGTKLYFIGQIAHH
jgi:hypothetical protein